MNQICTIHAVWQASSSYHFLSQNNRLLSSSASFSPPAHSKWELLGRMHSTSLDSGSFVALIRDFFACVCENIRRNWKWGKALEFGLCCCWFFKLLGRSIIIRENFWDSLMLRRASGDANKSSFYIWRWNHPRGKKRLFHLLKQVNPAFSQAEYASLEKKVAKSRSEVKMLLANFSCVLTLNHLHWEWSQAQTVLFCCQAQTALLPGEQLAGQKSCLCTLLKIQRLWKWSEQQKMS